MLRIFALCTLLLSTSANANESLKCLANILYNESRGESFRGAIAVGQAAIRRARNNNVSVCKVKADLKPIRSNTDNKLYYKLAQTLWYGDLPAVAGDSDSWNAGVKPAYKGRVNAVIGKHVFYTMEKSTK